MREIVERIVERLNNIEKEHFYKDYLNEKQSYNYISEFIKYLFAEEGRLSGYESAAHRNRYINNCKYDEGEWMFDFIWYKMSDTDNQIMTDVPLVLESELSGKELKDLKVDFDKLLVATSSTKIFVTTIHNIDKKIIYIQKAINSFNNFKINISKKILSRYPYVCVSVVEM